MYKVMTLGTLLVGLALTPFLSGEVESRRPPVEDPVVNSRAEQDGVVSEVEAAGPTKRACEWSCAVCEPDQGCTQTCTEIGECGSTCGFVMECEPGLRWDEIACACR